MDILIVSGGVVLLIIGILGCILPGLPGPPFAFLSLLILKLHSNPLVEPSTQTLLIFGISALLITILDYMLPIWGTKKFGGSKAGKNGSLIGLLVGLFIPVFGPFTIMIGPFAGAVIGELLAGQNRNTAFKSGIGSFLGFLGGTFLKLAICALIVFKFFRLLI
jgi:uncharacterized protein YqgC (DUF456 family)